MFKKKRNKRILIVSVIVLVLILAFASRSKNDSTVKVTVEKSLARDITETVAASGKIKPETEIKITPEISGEVVEVYVKEGDVVQNGDLLVKLNPDILEASLQRTEAGLNTSKANLANSKARRAQAKAQFTNTKLSFERTKQLHQQGAVSQSEYETALANFSSSKAELEAAKQSVVAAEYTVKSNRATLNEAKNNFKRTNIYAPANGIITALDVEAGETVLGTSQMAGKVIMNVSDLSIMEVDVEVNENDIVKVNLNDTAEIEVDAYLNETFTGVVTEIANTANNSNASVDQVTNFPVKMRILPSSYVRYLNPDKPNLSPFRPGMSATVEIKTATKKNVISIPIESITTRLDTSGGEKSYASKYLRKEQKSLESFECVFAVDHGKAKIIPVTSGIQDNKYIEVTKGLENGQEIITGPYDAIYRKLSHGDKVKISRDGTNPRK